MTTSKEKVRSVFLTTIMVLSLLAIGSAGFAGTAAANDHLDITTEPQTVVDDEITSVDVTVDGLEDESVEYNVGTDDGDSDVRSGTTDGEFSFTADPAGDDLSVGEEYHITVDPDGDAVTEQVTVVPEVDIDFDLEPANPAFGDEFVVSGEVANDNGDFDSEAFDGLQLAVNTGDYDESDNFDIRDGDGLRVLSDGTIDDVTVDAEDASEIVFVYEESDEAFPVEDATFDIESQDGSLTIDADDTLVAGDGTAQEYNISFTDAEEDGLTLGDDTADDYLGYLNVTGPFDTDQFEDIGEGEIVRIVSTEGDILDVAGDDMVADVSGDEFDGDVAYFHATTDDGAFNVSAEALEAGDNGVTVVPEVVNGDDVYTGGVEDGEHETFETLDIVADSASVAVEAGENLNLNLDPDELAVGDSELTVEVTGADFESVGEENALVEANVTLSSADLDAVSEETIELPTENSDHATFDALELESAGDLLIDVEATDEDNETYTASETVAVDGDVLVDISPEEATIDETPDVTIQLTDVDGNDVTDRSLELDGSALDQAIEIGSGSLESLDPSTYVFEDLEFDSTGTLDLTVEDDDEETTVDASDVVTVTGDERFDLRTDDDLLATAADNVSIEVYNLQDEAVENDSETLEELAGSLELSQDNGSVTVDDVSVSDAENGTILLEDVVADGAEPVSVSAETEDALEGDGEIDVVEPVIETDLDTLLTEGIETEDVGLEAFDPRDDSALEDGAVELTADGTDFYINDDPVDNGSSTEVDLDDNGTATVDLTPRAVDDSASISVAAQADTEDVGFYGETAIEAGELQLFERVDRSDEEVRDQIEPDFEEEIQFNLRDANGERLDDRTGDVVTDQNGISASFTVEEGIFTIDFADEAFDDLKTGELSINVDADFEGDVTAGTIDVVNEVNLTLEANETAVDAGEEIEFAIVREDTDDFTSGDLTFRNESGDEVQNENLSADPTAVTIDLDDGEYEAVASKEGDGTTFVDDAVNITVGDIDEEPSVDDYRTEDDTVETDNLRDAIADWRADDIDTDLLRDVIAAWRSS